MEGNMTLYIYLHFNQVFCPSSERHTFWSRDEGAQEVLVRLYITVKDGKILAVGRPDANLGPMLGISSLMRGQDCDTDDWAATLTWSGGSRGA